MAAVAVTALTVLSSIDLGSSYLVDVWVSRLIGTQVGLAIQALINSVGSSSVGGRWRASLHSRSAQWRGTRACGHRAHVHPITSSTVVVRSERGSRTRHTLLRGRTPRRQVDCGRTGDGSRPRPVHPSSLVKGGDSF